MTKMTELTSSEFSALLMHPMKKLNPSLFVDIYEGFYSVKCNVFFEYIIISICFSLTLVIPIAYHVTLVSSPFEW